MQGRELINTVIQYLYDNSNAPPFSNTFCQLESI